MAEDRIFQQNTPYPVHYRFRQASRDCQHLLIVMSGFNVPDPTIYDFTQVLGHCDSHLLWIKDDFAGLPAYYLCQDMSFGVENNVSQLINGVIQFLNCRQVSIVGSSKGGSAALYYGVKHNLANIVSVVPQFRIGSYVATGSYWENVGRHMMGEITDQNIDLLNHKLPLMLTTAKNTAQNIYMFTSTGDYQYESEIKPHLSCFERYNRFNLITSQSSLITEHNQVANYNIKLILSLIYQFENGISPEWGSVRNGGGWER
ncbi:hypothetical protein EGM70_01540 [Enterobacteriaceae bacterium 89]|nr:hypothetical protein [Enterobacteriaceae bacterium 89]